MEKIAIPGNYHLKEKKSLARGLAGIKIEESGWQRVPLDYAQQEVVKPSLPDPARDRRGFSLSFPKNYRNQYQ